MLDGLDNASIEMEEAKVCISDYLLQVGFCILFCFIQYSCLITLSFSINYNY